MNSDEAYISRVLESLFSGLRYTRYRTDAQTGKLNSDGTLNTDVSDGLAPPYIWVRFGEDRAAVPVLSKIRDGAGIPVIVAFDTLINEDVVLEVNLARAIPVYGESATAYNIPVIPAGFFTPTNARDVQPGSLRADTTGGLNTRIVPCWLPGGTWWDGGTIITLVPTATSSKQAFVVVGIDSTGAVVQDLTTDRALTYPLIDAEGILTALGATDIQAVTDADPTVFWVGAALLANGATAIDGSRIYDTRFWRPPTMAGADGSAAGAVGFVPTPAAADNTKFLRGDATWATVSGGTSLPVFGAGVTKTLASDVAAAGSDRHLIIAAQSGTADDLIEITGLSAGEEVIIRADAGDTITVKHNAGGATDKLLLYNELDLALTGDQTLKLVKTATGKVVQYVDETGSGSSATGTVWFPRAKPASPSGEDDEFADNSGGVPTGWTEVDHGTVTTVDEDVDGLRLTQSTHASNSVSGIYKAIPAGDFTIWSELAIYASVTGASQAAIVGLALYEDATSSTGDMALLYIGYAASNVPEFAVATFTAYNSGATGLASAFGNRITVPPRGFVRIRRTGTTYSYDISHDGLGAYRLHTGTLGFTPTHYGIAVSNLNSGADIRGVASFFRYTASDVGVVAPFEGRRVNYYA